MNQKADSITVEEVIEAFNNFLLRYDIWRRENGLSADIGNAYEITTSLADKVGRICRQVKHQERNDPKPDWPDGMTEEMAGVLIYLIILKKRYGIDIAKGMENELNKAVGQHGKKEEHSLT